jgi:hypothetical protein
MGLGWSDDHGWQSDDGIIAQGGHVFRRHVSGALDGPFVILLQQDRADEPYDGVEPYVRLRSARCYAHDPSRIIDAETEQKTQLPSLDRGTLM